MATLRRWPRGSRHAHLAGVVPARAPLSAWPLSVVAVGIDEAAVASAAAAVVPLPGRRL